RKMRSGPGVVKLTLVFEIKCRCAGAESVHDMPGDGIQKSDDIARYQQALAECIKPFGLISLPLRSLRLALHSRRELAYEQRSDQEGAERYPVLRIIHGELSHRLDEE